MKKIGCCLLALTLLFTGCSAARPALQDKVLQNAPTEIAATQPLTGTEPTQAQTQSTEATSVPEETELSRQTDPVVEQTQPTEPAPTEPKPTEPKPTEPKPTEPNPTEPKPTEPKPTEPKPTEPKPTEPKPTEPKPTEPKPTEPKPTEPAPTAPPQTEPPVVTEEDKNAFLFFTYTSLRLDLNNNCEYPLDYCYTGCRDLTWTSSNPEVAVVDLWGYITPQDFGKTIVTVTDGVLTAQCELTIRGVTILTPDRTRIGIGESLQLSYRYDGDPADLKWESRKDSIVSVDQTGRITGVSAGAELITAYDGEVSYCICIVVVSEDNLAREITMSNMNSPLYDGIVKYAGDYMTFWANTRPYGVDPKVVVSTDNPDVVSVRNEYNDYYEDNRIRLEFKKAGTATVTVSSADGAVAETYRITVKAEFDCYPGKEQLTPGEFAYYASQVGGELGQKVSYTLSGYRWLYVADADLTWSKAKGVGKSLAHEWYNIGIKGILVTYAGWSGEHNKHLFYVGY